MLPGFVIYKYAYKSATFFLGNGTDIFKASFPGKTNKISSA